MNKQSYQIEDIQRIRNSIAKKSFLAVYEKLMSGTELPEKDKSRIISVIAKLFSTGGDRGLLDMAYYMSIKYAIATEDYAPLEDIASKLSYYPVLKKIERKREKNNSENSRENLRRILDECIAEAYKNEYYCSRQQYFLQAKAEKLENVTTVAPTSYGKTNVLVRKCLNLVKIGKKVCIVTPTKSLLAQTLGRIVEERGSRGIVITHPDMLTNKIANKAHIALLTQERLMAILARDKNFYYDYIVVDEAHNLFGEEERASILAQVLMILVARNSKIRIDYYTPFSYEPEKSFLLLNQEDSERNINTISENMKIPQFFEIERNGKVFRYDQFLDLRIKEAGKRYRSAWDAFLDIAQNGKTIVYVNKPIDAEKVANEIYKRLDYGEIKEKWIEDSAKAFAEQAGTSYNLIKLMKRGILISHGKMLDMIRAHSEFLFREKKETRFIVTTSTLLEGVNIPADRMILLDYRRGRRKLSKADFLNLVGRVGRFNNIFDPSNNSLESLLPEIFVSNFTDIMPKRANLAEFLKDDAVASSGGSDAIKNPLLSQYDDEDKSPKVASRILDMCNIDPARKDAYLGICNYSPLKLAETEFGKSCYSRGVRFFDIIKNEHAISEALIRKKLSEKTISDAERLIECIKDNILANIDEVNINSNLIYKIKNVNGFGYIIKSAINDRIEEKAYYAKSIAKKIKQWQREIPKPVYVGEMGDCDRMGRTDNPWKNYHQFASADDPLIRSYAMGLVKENADNIDFELMPLIEVLNDMGLIDKRFYNLIKYGTNDEMEIHLIRAGADLTLARKIVEKPNLKDLFVIREEEIKCRDRDLLIEEMQEEGTPQMYIEAVSNMF